MRRPPSPSPTTWWTHGSDGLVIAGTTGEASTLTDEEKVALYRMAVREVGDRASVVAGTGSNDTAHSVHLTRAAAEAGVDAVLVVTPYYNRPPRAGIIGARRGDRRGRPAGDPLQHPGPLGASTSSPT